MVQRTRRDHCFQLFHIQLNLFNVSRAVHCVSFSVQWRAQAAARKALEIDETWAEAHSSLAFATAIYDWDWRKGSLNLSAAQVLLGYVYAQKGMLAEALAAQQQVGKVEDSSWVLSAIAHAYVVSGKREEAQKLPPKALEMAKRQYLSAVILARLYAALGEKEQAFALMYQACEEKAEELTLLQVDPQFDSLRSDPRYADLLQRLNLAP